MIAPTRTRPGDPRGAPRLGWLLALLVLAGCGSRATRVDRDDVIALAAGAAVAAEALPIQDVVLWAEQDGQRTSLWVRGNATGSLVVATRPGLVLPAGDALWEWREQPVELPLCDCEAWQDPELEETCPMSDEPATAHRVVLVDLVSGAELELLAAPTVDAEAGPELVYYQGGATPVASVGPYLFVRHGEETLTCGAAHNSWSGGFTVYDLDRREAIDLLAAGDRERIAAAEQLSAYQLFDGDRLVDIGGPDDLELTVIEPAYLPGRGLTVTYQFTADAAFADSDENWGSYSRSVRVEARTLPSALVPFAPLPPVLQNLAVVGDDLRVGGWIPFAGSGETMAALFAAFGVVEVEED